MYGGSTSENFLIPTGGGSGYWHVDIGNEEVKEVRQTNDGGYILVADTNSVDISGITKQDQGGHYDIYVIKLDKNGDL
jgi:hypothetical protein